MNPTENEIVEDENEIVKDDPITADWPASYIGLLGD